MANGSMIVGFDRPALPAGATMTEAEYHQALLDEWAEMQDKLGLVPVRGMWTAMKDVPTDGAGWGPFIMAELAKTKIDTADVALTQSGEVRYCITTGAQIDCYFKFSTAWTGTGPDPFEISVDVGGPNSPVVTRVMFEGTVSDDIPD